MSITPPASHRLLDVPLDSPTRQFSFRTFLKYAGPGWLMSLAFIDPGNIEADLQSGAFAGFSFVWVLLLAHIAGLVLQILASRIGVVTGQGLARICRDHYPHYLSLFLWLMAELAIIGSDVQEVVGSSIALNLLFGIPLWQGVLVTGLSTIAFLVLYLYRGVELIEYLILSVIGVIFVCFSTDFVATNPDLGALARGLFVPSMPATAAETTQLVALIGSVVMPHNLFLHSSLIGKKLINRSSSGQLLQAVKYFAFDAGFALMFSFLINLSLQGSFAQGFYSPVCAENPSGPLGCDPTIRDPLNVSGCGLGDCACITPSGLPGFCSQIGLSNAGNALAFILPRQGSILFGIGLLAAGQASTLSGTMAGQFVMEGFLELKVPFYLRMLFTRGIALVPALAVSLMQSEFTGMNNLSQSLNVLQSVQLPFALLPLLHFCAESGVMGQWTVGRQTMVIGWIVAGGLIGVNGYLLLQQWAQVSWRWRSVCTAMGMVYVTIIGWVLKPEVSRIWKCLTRRPGDTTPCDVQSEYHRMHNTS